jgi:hypothetical protein
MISLAGLVSQKAFGKFEMGKVISNPFATAFVNEAEGEDHEVSMGQNQLDTIIKMATELKAKMGEDEKQIPAWIQDHISKAENYISQAAGNYHEYGDSNENINEAPNDKQITSLEKEHQMLAAKGSAIMDKQRQLIRTTLGNKFEYPWENYDKWPTKLKIEVEKLNLQFEKNNVEVQKAFEKLMKAKGTWRTESIKEASPCWKGYKQVGMKDKGGRQVPNCVPNESVVNEAPNTGERIQNLNNRIKALRDKLSATKSPEQKKLFQNRLKNALQTLSNIKKDFGIKKEISNKTPKIFVKTAAVEKKIRELMADRKKAVVPYNTEKDPDKKEKLKQILIKLTQQIQGYEKNLIQLRDMEEEYLQQMHADAELDTTGL